jgi:cyclopropane fatty-acyl-phospholipid synthase-like methyltransferase
LTDLIVFNDKQLASRYAAAKIPMATLLEAYLDGAIDIPNMDAFLDARRDLVNFNLTAKHFEFFFTRMIPEVAIHSKSQDERIVREHYDRGDDFFESFLGDRMVYTSGIFNDEHESLEQAQDNKMNLVCRKLMLQPGQEMLDIGCGWGTLAMHAAKHFGARSTGITISKNQTEYGNNRISKAGLSERARIECLDYRDIPRKQYDRISSLEMVEHVGVKNLSKYCKLVYDLLKDDGIFLLQWVGLRRGGDLGIPVLGLRPEDLIWGLFMNKYIFPGADASIPLSDMSKALEKAGFQIQSVENISIHYSETIRLWHLNWQKHHAAVLQAYGERWYRLWHLFLGWSWRIAAQGTGQGFQLVAHKNIDAFDRKMFIRHADKVSPVRHERDRAPAIAVNGNGRAHAE